MTTPINNSSTDVAVNQRSDFSYSAKRGGKLLISERVDGSTTDNIKWPPNSPSGHKKQIQEAVLNISAKRDELYQKAQNAEANGNPNLAASYRHEADNLDSKLKTLKLTIENDFGSGMGALPLRASLGVAKAIDLKPANKLLAQANLAMSVAADPQPQMIYMDTTTSAATSGTSGLTADELFGMSDTDLLDAVESDPQSFYKNLAGMKSEDRSALMMRINTLIQQNNQTFSAVSNMMKALHDTQKAVLANLRV